MAKDKKVYRVSVALVEAWKKQFSAEDREAFDAQVTQETVYRIPRELVDAWRKKFAEAQKVKVDVDELLQDAVLQDRVARVARLVDQGATWDAQTHSWSLGGKTYDEDGNPQ